MTEGHISTPPSAPAATARAILGAADCKVIGIDRDPQRARARRRRWSQAANGRLTLVEDRFSNLDAVARAAGFDAVDGVVLDLGVSSMQLDTAERGFSFRLDGPLDMRMGGEGASAADVVNAASERDLANIIFLLGEERHSRAVARAIVKARTDAPIETTRALADIVGSRGALAPGRHSSGDPHVPGVAYFRERRTGRTGRRRCERPSASSSPKAGWSRCRSIRSRTAS